MLAERPIAREANNRPVSRERITPQSLEAEQSVLGAMMMERDSIARAVELLTGDDFYRELHRKIFAVVMSLFDQGEPVDLITVTEELRRKGQLEEVGGAAYLTALIEACPSAANVESYAKAVVEKSTLRNLLKASERIAGDVYNGEKSVDEIVEAAESGVLACGRAQVGGAAFGMSELIQSSRAQIMKTALDPQSAQGVASGLYDLDGMTGGWQKSDLIILAARPSLGKTSMAMQFALRAAQSVEYSRPVIVFSLEMSKEQLISRLIASQARVNGLALRKGTLADEDWERIDEATQALAALPIFVLDTPAMTTFEMRAHIRRISVAHGAPCLLVMDYLQKARTKSKTENRRLEIEAVAGDCKNIAREFRCPFVVLSQLSRAVDARENKRPFMSDLAESGAIEAEADIVALLYREGYYKRKEAPSAQSWGPVDDESAELIIGKHRNGPTGTVQLLWREEYTRFENLA